MKKATEKYTILYGRLSQEDKNIGESDSIQNQRLILEKYALDNGFQNTLFKFDDGCTGTSFDRPAWNEVMKLIENNMVSSIIVKDMSRLGRNYLLIGNLMEEVFPQYNIRFIAIGSSVDSDIKKDNDFTPFLNIIDEWYAKDCSRKIKAANRAKAETGAKTGGRAPFGYQKDPQNPKTKIIIDPQTAPIIEKIFKLCMEGNGPTQIARQLEKEQVMNPTNYYFKNTGVALTGLDTTRPYFWSTGTIKFIIQNQVYMGNTVSLKTSKVSYKGKKRITNEPEDCLIFENTHEKIVTKEIWEIAQDLRKTQKRPRKEMDTPHPYSGLIYCADCGKVLAVNRAHNISPDKTRFTCTTYKKYGKDACSGHYVGVKQIEAIVLDELKRVTHFARQKEKLFADYINKKSSTESRKQITRITKEIDGYNRRDLELTALFKRLYEDNVIGRISDDTFNLLSKEYTSEQAILRGKLPQLESKVEKLKTALSNVYQFIERAKRYSDITELTPEILHLFIEKIVVEERAVKYSQAGNQKIWIYYRDIGLLDGTEGCEEHGVEPHYDFELSHKGELIAV